MPMSVAGRRTERGFTLLELLVTMCIVGFLSAVAAGASSSGETRRLQRDAFAIGELLGKAKRLAQISGSAQKIEMRAGNMSLARTESRVIPSKGTRVRLFYPGSPRIASDALYFFPDGSSTGGTIEIGVAGGGRVIEIDALGRMNARNQ